MEKIYQVMKLDLGSIANFRDEIEVNDDIR